MEYKVIGLCTKRQGWETGLLCFVKSIQDEKRSYCALYKAPRMEIGRSNFYKVPSTGNKFLGYVTR
jgi:hypothetical protein